MTTELWFLSGALLLGLFHIVCAVLSYRAQVGFWHLLGTRDDDPAPDRRTARLFKAQRNYMETFPYFLAAVFLVHFADISNFWTFAGCALYLAGRIAYFGCYWLGVPWVRTATWLVATGGLALVAVQPVFV